MYFRISHLRCHFGGWHGRDVLFAWDCNRFIVVIEQHLGEGCPGALDLQVIQGARYFWLI